MPSTRGQFAFQLNRNTVEVGGIAPQTSLLDFVRSRGLTGAKEGCAEGECGACAVIIVVPDVSGNPTYQSVNSCLVPLPAIADREVYTVEALSETNQVADVQQAMIDHNGSQCGY